MRWFRKKPKPLPIPVFAPPVEIRAKPDPGIVVEESSLSEVGIDVEAMSRTGIHKAWDRFAARVKGEE